VQIVGRTDLDREASRNARLQPAKGATMPALLKVTTLLALAGMVLALALTDPGLAGRDGVQASQPEPVGARLERHIAAVPAWAVPRD
jgi:hypothetical protein